LARGRGGERCLELLTERRKDRKTERRKRRRDGADGESGLGDLETWRLGDRDDGDERMME